MIKAVIFDFDDTLVLSRRAKWDHHKYVAKNFYNIDLTDDDFLPHWGKPIDQLMKILYKDSETVEKMYEALISVRDKFRKIKIDGAPEMVNELLNKGIKIGILSATNRRFLKGDMEEFNFPADRFEFIQGGDDTTVHKPDPRVFDGALEKLLSQGIKKEEIVYVGDSMDDFQAATGAGIKFVAVLQGLYSDLDFKNKGVEKICNNILEFKDIIHD